MLILGILGILVVFLWIATILWILTRLLAHRQPTADAERFESESRGSWVPEDPCNEARIPVIVVRESVMRVLNEYLQPTPYFLPPGTPSAVRIERAWSLRRSGTYLWRVDVAAFVLNRRNVELGGACVRLRLQHPLTSASLENDDMELVATATATPPRIVQENMPSERILMLSASPNCGPL